MKLKQKKGNPNKSPNTEYPAGSRCDGLPLDAEQSECLVSLLLSLPPPGFHSTRDGTLIFITHHQHYWFFNHNNQTSISSLNVVILCSRFCSVDVLQISSGVRLEQWNLWNKTFLTYFLRQVDSSKIRNIYHCLHNVDCFDFRKCNYWFSPPVTCWQCPM